MNNRSFQHVHVQACHPRLALLLLLLTKFNLKLNRSRIQYSASPPPYSTRRQRTVVAPPSSVVKCLWEVFVWGVVLVLCVCVSVSGVLFSVGGFVCDLLIFLHAGMRQLQRPCALLLASVPEGGLVQRPQAQLRPTAAVVKRREGRRPAEVGSLEPYVGNPGFGLHCQPWIH